MSQPSPIPALLSVTFTSLIVFFVPFATAGAGTDGTAGTGTGDLRFGFGDLC